MRIAQQARFKFQGPANVPTYAMPRPGKFRNQPLIPAHIKTVIANEDLSQLFALRLSA